MDVLAVLQVACMAEVLPSVAPAALPRTCPRAKVVTLVVQQVQEGLQLEVGRKEVDPRAVAAEVVTLKSMLATLTQT